MELSQSDLEQLAEFSRNVPNSPSAEAVVSEAFRMLRKVAGVRKMRVVHRSSSSAWTEWNANGKGIHHRERAEWPAPPRKDATVMFDSGTEQSGFLSVERCSPKSLWIAEIVAPQIQTALALQAAVDRARKVSISETELSRETLRARDEERRRIAHELHDDVSQSIVSLKLSLKWAEEQIKDKPEMTEVRRELSASREGVSALLARIRDMSHVLYPRILDTLGFVPALQELIQHVTRHSGIAARCTVTGKPLTLGEEAAVALYRCCQEAINNTIRHAEASRMNVEVRFSPDQVRVTVEDNGRGFNPRSLYDSNGKLMSSGFWSIRQRMAAVGGAFRVSTAVGKGTAVEIMLPSSLGKVHAKRKNKTTHRR